MFSSAKEFTIVVYKIDGVANAISASNPHQNDSSALEEDLDREHLLLLIHSPVSQFNPSGTFSGGDKKKRNSTEKSNSISICNSVAVAVKQG